MTRTVVQILKSAWKPLALTAMFFHALTFILLTPLISGLFRVFLSLSGRTILADVDIARFFLHPIGWAAIIIVGGVLVGMAAWEQSALMALALASAHEKNLTVLGSLRFISGKSVGIFLIAARMVAGVLALTLPFVAIGGGLSLALLTDHDINFYLTVKPPRFWMAVILIAIDLGMLAVLILRCVVSWAIAMQLHLFENVSPGDSLAVSRERLLGSRKIIAKWIILWAAVNAIISSAASAIVARIGQGIVPHADSSLWRLVITLGMVLSLWSIVNFVTNLLAVISFAAVQSLVYDRFGRSSAFQLPEECAVRNPLSLSWTRGRILAGLAVGVVAAAVVGATAVHSVRLEDHVEITAHRGGAGNAPENTLAAMRRAIEDRADWVEIDVQESKDGVVMVVHDSDLKKVSRNAVKIWEATADELRSIDIGSFFSPEDSGERMPTLAEVLETCRGKVRVNIELKYYGHDQDLERKVVDLVEEQGMASQIVVMSLKAEGIRQVKELRPDWTVGLLTAAAVGDLTRANADFLAVNAKLAKPSFVRSAHRQGKPVHVWTVNDSITMSTMIGRGVDHLITDYPDVARRVLAERAAMSPVERVLIEFAFLFRIGPNESAEQSPGASLSPRELFIDNFQVFSQASLMLSKASAPADP